MSDHVNSMSDLFHPDVPSAIISDVFTVMNETRRHRFQVLTKRSHRLARDAGHLEWSDNIWMGVSIENQRYCFRIDHLREVPSRIRFLSLEPLIGPLPDLDLTGIHWVIVGGESGHKARPVDPGWVRDIRDQCAEASVPFFFRQWGGRTVKSGGRLLDDRTLDEMPN